jgi:aminoglycoside/choline kinase family phosphotransferase
LDSKIKEEIYGLFEACFGEAASYMEMLPPSGSYREYCRLKSASHTAIGAYNRDVQENRAFLSFSRHFRAQGVNVPEIYAVNTLGTCYLQEDLGSLTLFDFLTGERQKGDFPDAVIAVYKQVLNELPKIQVVAGAGIDYTCCYPRAAFDKQSMMWDLNYFKYYFLKLAHIPFDEQALEDDFERFTQFLLSADTGYFLFRDFQSRNIMLHKGTVYFIDYQGGRKGALQYDLASLLYDAKAGIPQDVRNMLLEYYLDVLQRYVQPLDREAFRSYFTGYVLIRIMQAMGAYGFRGFYEKKEHFLKSIPYALDNLQYLLQSSRMAAQLPELYRVLSDVAESEELRAIGAADELTVSVVSFSYRKGLPADPSGNGGGFVFDCRALKNPGRLDEYRMLTGKDPSVAQFLKALPETEPFLSNCFGLVEHTIKVYLQRNYTHLTVGFGCTGGQHRSVYSAERMATFLRNFPVRVKLTHRELEKAGK